jgi:hypothetical protein
LRGIAHRVEQRTQEPLEGRDPGLHCAEAGAARAVEERARERGLADARLSGQQDRGAPARPHLLQKTAELLELGVAAEQLGRRHAHRQRALGGRRGPPQAGADLPARGPRRRIFFQAVPEQAGDMRRNVRLARRRVGRQDRVEEVHQPRRGERMAAVEQVVRDDAETPDVGRRRGDRSVDDFRREKARRAGQLTRGAALEAGLGQQAR